MMTQLAKHGEVEYHCIRSEASKKGAKTQLAKLGELNIVT